MVGLRRGWAVVCAMIALGAVARAAEPPRVLKAISVRRVREGARLELAVSRPGIPRFAVVRGTGSSLDRLHIDLPRGTILATDLTRSVGQVAPVVGVRLGLLEDGAPRIIVELAGASDYRLDPDPGPATIAVLLIGEGQGAATPPAAAAPGATHGASPPAPRTPPKRTRPKIVLDPGHGGDDPGAEGHAVEKEVTLDIALRLAARLRANLGADVVLTRTADDTLALKDRTTRANAEDADLFVSIHANANPTGDAKGVETYFLDNATDQATLRLAKMENGLDLLGGDGKESGLRYILSDMVQGGKIEHSARLARHLQRGLVTHLRRHYPGVVDLGVKRGPFYVLVGAYMPCVLVETAFLTHPVEGRRLATEAYRDEVAQGLYAGISRYLADRGRRRTL